MARGGGVGEAAVAWSRGGRWGGGGGLGFARGREDEILVDERKRCE